MDVKNTHSVTKTEISVFGRQALGAERRRSPSLADKVLTWITLLPLLSWTVHLRNTIFCWYVFTPPHTVLCNTWMAPNTTLLAPRRRLQCRRRVRERQRNSTELLWGFHSEDGGMGEDKGTCRFANYIIYANNMIKRTTLRVVYICFPMIQ